MNEVVHARSAVELEGISRILHDQWVRLAVPGALGPRPARLEIPLLVALTSEKASVRRGFFANEYRMPLLRHLLVIEGVDSVRVLSDQGIEVYTLNELVLPDATTLELRTNERTRLRISVRAIDVRLLTDSKVGGHLRIRQGLFGRTMSRVEHGESWTE